MQEVGGGTCITVSTICTQALAVDVHSCSFTKYLAVSQLHMLVQESY
jgi:hypothetical protein